MNLFPWEPAIRLGCFAGAFLLMALWEVLAPRRPLTAGRPLRWAGNLGLVALNNLVVRFLVPLGAVGTALLAHEGMTIGLSHPRDARRTQRLHWMLLLPFLGRTGSPGQ